MLPDHRSTLLGVFGTPSSLTYWGIHVVRTIVGVVLGDYHFVHGHFLSEFADAAAGRIDHGSAICVSDCPEVDVCTSFIESNVPMIVFVEQPAAIIADMVSAGIDPVSALRLATRSLCTIQPFFEAPSAIILRHECLDTDTKLLFDVIVRALRLTATGEQRSTIEHLLRPPGSEGVLTVRDHVTHTFPDFARRGGERASPAAVAVQGIADSYEQLIHGEALQVTEWPAAIFSSGDAIGTYVVGPNELIGPARILVYGPYMHLPRGDWSAYVELEVSENESGNRLKVDLVGGPRILGSVVAEMPPAGRYCFSLPFSISEPLQPVEMRFQIESGAIEGRFLLTKVVMTAEHFEDADA